MEGKEITKDDVLATETPAPHKIKNPEKELTENERLKARLYEQERQNKLLTERLEAAQEEKRKPGITQVDDEGKQMKKKRPSENPWGLTDMILPPYTKRQVAIYKICEGDEGVNPATGLPVELFDVSVPGQYTCYDRFEENAFKKDKILQNITGTKTSIENGKPVIEQTVEDILFHRGFLWVHVESDYNLFVFMELHPNNKSNKFRTNNAPKIFERIDINTKSAASLSAMQDLVLDAGNMVREMDKEDVLAYAASVPEISTSAGRQLHEIRTDLKTWAMKNPQQFFKLTKNTKAAIQITVLDAINFGLIGYRMDIKSYVNLETDEKICTNTASEDPMERLVKFLGTAGDGQSWYKQIQERMNYWNND